MPTDCVIGKLISKREITQSVNNITYIGNLIDQYKIFNLCCAAPAAVFVKNASFNAKQ